MIDLPYAYGKFFHPIDPCWTSTAALEECRFFYICQISSHNLKIVFLHADMILVSRCSKCSYSFSMKLELMRCIKRGARVSS